MKVGFFCSRVVVLALLLGMAHGVSAQGSQKAPEPARPGHIELPYRGGLVNPPLPKPKFTLTDTSGAPFDFASKTQGSVTLLFFGYVHCPDMCPLQMYMIASALKKMP